MQIQKFVVRVVVTLIVAIVVIAVFFHYSITILNAVTEASVPESGMHLSGWRIQFEPFPGLWLFFNPSFNAIKVFGLLLFRFLSLVPGISYLLQNQIVGDSGRMHPEYDWLPGRAGRVLLAGSGKVACYRMKREKLIGLNQ